MNHLGNHLACTVGQVVILVGGPVAGGIVDRDGMASEIRPPLQGGFPPCVSRAYGKDYWKYDGHSHQHVRKLRREVIDKAKVCTEDGQRRNDKCFVVDDERKTGDDLLHGIRITSEVLEKEGYFQIVKVI